MAGTQNVSVKRPALRPRVGVEKQNQSCWTRPVLRAKNTSKPPATNVRQVRELDTAHWRRLRYGRPRCAVRPG